MSALTAASVATFVAVMLISLWAGERLFPFSTLGMFAYPYRPHIAVLIIDTTTGTVLPAVESIGLTTSGMSQEVARRLAAGQQPGHIADDLRARLRPTSARRGDVDFVVRQISVDQAALVHTQTQRLVDLADNRPDG